MNLLGRILKELKTPDDQGNDWYGWTSNQMAHALLGVVVALFFAGAPIEMAVIIAALKEVGDLAKNPARAVVQDSLQDILFWGLGAWLVSAESPILPTLVIAFALICGVVPRVRQLHKK